MTRAFVESWQIQCCGDPFEVGSSVAWNVVEVADGEFLATVLGNASADRVEYFEDHHDLETGPSAQLRGTVRSIDAVFCGYELTSPSSKALTPMPGTGVVERRNRVDGWESEDPHSRVFIGYLVDIDEAGTPASETQPFDRSASSG